jgi:hypothetical protein
MIKIQLQIDSLFFKFLLVLVDPNDPWCYCKKMTNNMGRHPRPKFMCFRWTTHNQGYKGKLTFLKFSLSLVFFHNFDERKHIHIHMWILGDISNRGSFKKRFFLIIQIFKLLFYGVKISWNYATCHLSSTTHTLSSKLRLHIKNASNMLGRSKLNTYVQPRILILIIRRKTYTWHRIHLESNLDL